MEPQVQCTCVSRIKHNVPVNSSSLLQLQVGLIMIFIHCTSFPIGQFLKLFVFLYCRIAHMDHYATQSSAIKCIHVLLFLTRI